MQTHTSHHQITAADIDQEAYVSPDYKVAVTLGDNLDKYWFDSPNQLIEFANKLRDLGYAARDTADDGTIKYVHVVS